MKSEVFDWDCLKSIKILRYSIEILNYATKSGGIQLRFNYALKSDCIQLGLFKIH